MPDLVTIETTACPWPYSVENAFRSRLTSWTVSIGGLSDMLFQRSVLT